MSKKRFTVKVRGYTASIWIKEEKGRCIARAHCPKVWCRDYFTSSYKSERDAARSRSLVKQHLEKHLRKRHPAGKDKASIGTLSIWVRRRLVKIKVYQQSGNLFGAEVECPVGKCREAFFIYGRSSEKNVQAAISRRLNGHFRLHPL